MRMQDFQTQQIPYATEPMTMLDFQTQPPSGKELRSPNENAGFPDTTNTICNRTNDNAGFPDTQPPSGKELRSPNENAGFPDTTNTICNRTNDNAGFPYTQPLSK